MGGALTWDRLANRDERRAMMSVKAESMQRFATIVEVDCFFFCASCDFGCRWMEFEWNAQGVLVGAEWGMENAQKAKRN